MTIYLQGYFPAVGGRYKVQGLMRAGQNTGPAADAFPLIKAGDQLLAGAAVNALAFILVHLPRAHIASGAAAISLFISFSVLRKTPRFPNLTFLSPAVFVAS